MNRVVSHELMRSVSWTEWWGGGPSLTDTETKETREELSIKWDAMTMMRELDGEADISFVQNDPFPVSVSYWIRVTSWQLDGTME